MRFWPPLAFAAVAGCGPPAMPADPSLAVVDRVIDGDTIDVVIGGNHERVRLIGIDAPEIAHPSSGNRPANDAECFGDEAKAFTESLLAPGTQVRLERDVVPRDDYGRLLAYVHIANGERFVNLELAVQGYAQPLTIEPNATFSSAIVHAARLAEQGDAGLWGAC